MRWKAAVLLALTVVWGLAWPASAQREGYAKADALFLAGDFHAAAERAAGLDTADGLALAARATLVELDYLTTGPARTPLLDRAESFARHALALNAHHVEGRLHLAIALGHRARVRGAMEAHILGFADEGRSLLDSALAYSPDNAWCHALLGAWHLEIVRYGGGPLGDLFYGADVGQGLAHFARAFELAPENLLLHGEFAVALLALDPDAHGLEAAGHLNEALQIEAQSAVDHLAQARAGVVLSLLKSGDHQALAELLETIRGRPDRPLGPVGTKRLDD